MSGEPLVEFLDPREIAIREFNGLRGRLCAAIESMGLPNKQERAVITLIKQGSYQQQRVIAELIEKLDEHDRKFRYVGNRLELE